MGEPVTVTFGGVPGWLLRAYLLELGGMETPDGGVQGSDWRARLEADSGGAGHLRVGRVTVTIEGAGAAGVMEALRRKAQRGGG